MGDRVTVYLSILESDMPRALPLIEEHDGKPDECDSRYNCRDEHSGARTQIASLCFYEINYGNMGCLTALQEAGIPYESSWDAGGDFGAGTQYLRFNAQGEPVIHEIYDGDENPPIGELLSRIDNYEDLKWYIIKYQRDVPLGWDTQQENTKLYRTRALINP